MNTLFSFIWKLAFFVFYIKISLLKCGDIKLAFLATSNVRLVLINNSQTRCFLKLRCKCLSSMNWLQTVFCNFVFRGCHGMSQHHKSLTRLKTVLFHAVSDKLQRVKSRVELMINQRCSLKLSCNCLSSMSWF